MVAKTPDRRRKRREEKEECMNNVCALKEVRAHPVFLINLQSSKLHQGDKLGVEESKGKSNTNGGPEDRMDRK